jgi:hypothetical protein
LEKLGTPDEGYNKVKVFIRWNNDAYLEDRVDLGLSGGNFDPQKEFIGAYLKKQKGAMYSSSFEEGDGDKSRESVDWGQAIGSEGKSSTESKYTDEEIKNYVRIWLKDQGYSDESGTTTVKDVIARIVENRNGGSIEDLKQIESIAKKYAQLREYVYSNDIMDNTSPEYSEIIERAYVKGFVEMVAKTIDYVSKFYSDGGEPSIFREEVYIAMPVLAQLDTFDTKYIKNLNNK